MPTSDDLNAVPPTPTPDINSNRPTPSRLSVYRVMIADKFEPLQFQSYFRLCAAIESRVVKNTFIFWLGENEYNLN